MHASALLFVPWPLLGAVHLVLTAWNMRRFQASGASRPSPPEGNAPAARPVSPGEVPLPPEVSVVVPVRDEAGTLPACLAGLMAQDLTRVQVLVVDDGSTDGSAEVSRQAAEEQAGVQVLTASEPEAGWSGKAWACARGYEEAQGRWLVFLDGDVVLAPGALEAALTEAKAADMLIWAPRHPAGGHPLHTALAPLTEALALASLPLDAVEGLPDARLAWPLGACLVIERGAYQRAGGHAATSGTTAVALALGRAVKASGGRVRVRDAGPWAAHAGPRGASPGADAAEGAPPPAAAGRPGPVLEDLRRTLYPALGGAELPLLAGVALVLVLYVLPPLAAAVGWVAGWPGLATAGLLQTVLAIAGRAWQVVRLGQAPWTAPLVPLAAAAWVGLALASRGAWRQGGVAWKGRACPAPVAPQAGTR
ncbi:MAG: glycosyltransferase family A protein [Candidatus Sericytochromatia bacterium]|nr:glycosyltransferase family A protein [Candidatus Sericytochromatia bacterium]